MDKGPLIKKEIKWRHLNFQLFEVPDNKISYDSISNLNAVDEMKNVIWNAEIPKTHYDYYYDIKFDSDKNLIIANSRIGYHYLLNPENGKIIDYYLVK